MEMSEKEIYTIEEAAQILKVSQGTIRRWINSGKLLSSKLGRLHRISGADLHKFMTKNRGQNTNS